MSLRGKEVRGAVILFFCPGAVCPWLYVKNGKARTWTSNA